MKERLLASILLESRRWAAERARPDARCSYQIFISENQGGRRTTPPFCFARDSLILQTNLRQAHECGHIIPKVDLHLWAALEIDDRSYCCLFNSTRRQQDDYTITDTVLTVVGLSL